MDKTLNKLSGLEYVLECIKQYQRPILSIIFGGVICFVFYQCITGKIDCVTNPMIETILYLMSSYMGIYGIGRSFEKISGKGKEIKEILLDTVRSDDRVKEKI